MEQYVGEAPHIPIHKFKGFYFQPLANSFQAEWVHISDNLGNLILKEEFDDCTNMAHFTGNACKPDCENAFTEYYNNKFNTSFSYNEVKALHTAQCSDTCLNVCTSCTPTSGILNRCLSCDTLKVLVKEYFNLQTKNAGTEAGMLLYMQSRLAAINLTYSTQQVLQALTSCNNSWKKNVAYSGRTPRLTFNDTTKLQVGTGDFTMEAWVYPNVKKVDRQMVAIKANNNLAYGSGSLWGEFKGYALYISNGHVYFEVGDGTCPYNPLDPDHTALPEYGGLVIIKTTSEVTIEKWQHIVAVKVGNSWNDYKIFIDGQPQTTEVHAGCSYLTTGNVDFPETVFIGQSSWSGWNVLAFDGFIKNYRFYKRSLPNAEVSANYNCTEEPTNTNALTLYAKIDEGSGYTVIDHSANPDNGVMEYDTTGLTNWGGGVGPSVPGSCLPNITVLCPPQRPTLYLCGKAEPIFPEIALDSIDNCSDSSFFNVSVGTELYNAYSDSLKNAFDSSYRTKCLQAYKYETFTVEHTLNEYHYTLYYYDQSGSLIKTVPPQGVNASYDSVWLSEVRQARANGTTKVPAHTLVTQYRYNTLNQVMAQNTPDAGLSKFWYDRLGRLVISQNAEQIKTNKYSYTNYDVLGRISEVGELTSTNTITDSLSRVESNLQQWLTAAVSSRTQVTKTDYDIALWQIEPGLAAKNLRNRVSKTAIYNTAADITAGNLFLRAILVMIFMVM